MDPADLLSTVDKTLEECSQFRILAAGNSGVGKSTLISSVFNIEIKDISHYGAGQSDIHKEYISPHNPRFILHDSNGFEHGSTKNYEDAESFIHDRCARSELKDRLHAIWLCIETPRTGVRLLQEGDERLLKLADEEKVVVIVVFTKYDVLVKELLTGWTVFLGLIDILRNVQY